MKILKLVITFVLSVTAIDNSYAQLYVAKEFSLNNDKSGTTKEYKAQQLVRLSPNFKYTPSAGKYFKAHIDKNLILDTDYSSVNSTYYSNRQLDLNLPVGTISGAANVTPSGGAAYSIPFSMPKGTNGMEPSVGIAYNSQAGKSILGYGWNISGLSAITRVPKDRFEDFTHYPVKYNYNDRFALDGQRLVVKGYGSDFDLGAVNKYGKDGTQYLTIPETFSLIESKGTEGLGPKWFKVITKDGMIMEYGRTDDSRFKPGSENSALIWNLNRIYDQVGNYIDFEYRKIGNQLVIDKIKYTGNFNEHLSPYAEIKFYYDKRDDKTFYFKYGQKIEQNLLLREVEISVENKVFRRYVFEYLFENGTSKLLSVKESVTDRQFLNSTLVEYFPSGTPISKKSLVLDQTELVSGDYNGDGKSDIIALQYEVNQGVKTYKSFDLHLNQGNQNFTKVSSTSLPDKKNFNQDAYLAKHGYYTNFNYNVSDINGDGKDDFVFVAKNPQSGTSDTYDYFYAYESNGTSFSINASFSFPRSIYAQYLLGSFNGDGVSQLVVPDTNGELFAIYDFQEHDLMHIQNFPSTLNFTDDDTFYIVDFDGDGTSEIMVIRNNKTTVFDVYKDTDGKYYADIIYFDGFPTKGHERIRFGDFNGDGITDILSYPKGATSWKLNFGRGRDNYTSAMNINFLPDENYNSTSDDYDVFVLDVDGDGQSEIIHFKDTWSNSVLDYTTITVYDFNHIDLSNNSMSYRSYSYQDNEGATFRELFLAGDFTGDGKLELFHAFTSTQHIYSFSKNSQENLVKNIYDGFNNKTSFGYTSLSRASSDVYQSIIPQTSSIGNTPILVDFQRSIYLCTNLRNYQNNNIKVKDISYRYRGARLNRFGKGFIGFKEMLTYNHLNNVYAHNKFDFLSPYVSPTLVESNSKRVDNNSLLSKETFNYQGGVFQQRVYNRLELSTSENFLSNSSVDIEYLYDSNGNITNTHKTFSNGEEEFAVYDNFVDNGTWYDNKPTEITATKQKVPYASISRTTSFSFNSEGQVISKTEYVGQTDEITTTYEYGRFGNSVKTIVETTDANIPVKEARVNMDNKGRFVTNTYDPLNFRTNYEYDAFGNLIEQSVENNKLLTSYEYDGFGRETKQITPQGEYETSYEWEAYSASTGTRYSITKSGDNAPEAKTYFTSLGQDIKSIVETFSGNVITVKTYYPNGQLKSETSPHFSGDSKITTNYNYDPLNRVNTISNNLGTTSYSYGVLSSGGRRVTVNSYDGKTSTQKIDILGRVIESEDEGGRVTYTYYPDGQLHKVSVNGVQMSEVKYDEFGNQSELIDANAGHSFYTYNVLGQLTSQLDAKSHATTLTYDELGNVLTKTNGGKTTSYTYYYGGVRHGLLQNIHGADNTSEEYEYDDEFGQLIRLTENIENKTYISEYQYDDFGNLSLMTYPSGLQLEYEYDGNGTKFSVRNKNTSQRIWSLGSLNALGQYTSYTLGNNIETEKTYDIYGLPEQFKAGSVQDLRFDFDELTGNLLERADYSGNQALVENFEYDDLDRLTESEVIGSNFPVGLNYASNGNITDKTDAGAYYYNNSHPNQVEHVIKPTWSDNISQNDQDITYNAFNKAELIEENGYTLEFTYGHDDERRKTVMTSSNGTEYTKYYSNLAEEIEMQGNNDVYIEYISCGSGLTALNVIEGNGANTNTMYYVYTDHLGSILTLTDESGNVVHKQNFDAWGRYRNPDSWDYSNTPLTFNDDFYWLRGFTGHEHLSEFTLINMNGRLYDPVVGRMLSPDNYVQAAGYSQNYNRYSYAFNNPLRYTDLNGDVVFVAVPFIAGAIINATVAGIYGYKSGHRGANLAFDIFYGAITGAISGGAGFGLGAAGFAGANTTALIVSSTIASTSSYGATDGQSGISTSFGAASFNWTNNNWGYLGKKGNSRFENIGYSFGALANVSDILAGANPGEVQLNTEKSDAIGHSAITKVGETDPNSSIVSVGPNPGGLPKSEFLNPFKFHGGTNKWKNYVNAGDDVKKVIVSGVNLKRLSKYGASLSEGVRYNTFCSSCVNHAARALTISGVPTIGIHPFILHSQVYLRSIGIRPILYSHYFYNY